MRIMWVCLFDRWILSNCDYWSPALKGTETLNMTFTGPIMDDENKKDFIRQFIEVASMKAKLLE